MVSNNVFNILFKLCCDTFYSTVLRTVRMIRVIRSPLCLQRRLLVSLELGLQLRDPVAFHSSNIHPPARRPNKVFYKGNKVTAHLYLVESRSKVPFLLFVSRGFSSTVPNVKLSTPFCNSPFWK